MTTENHHKYLKRLLAMLAASSKDDVAACALYLALSVAAYAMKFGNIEALSQLEMLELVNEIGANDDEFKTNALRKMVAALATVTMEVDESEELIESLYQSIH